MSSRLLQIVYLILLFAVLYIFIRALWPDLPIVKDLTATPMMRALDPCCLQPATKAVEQIYGSVPRIEIVRSLATNFWSQIMAEVWDKGIVNGVIGLFSATFIGLLSLTYNFSRNRPIRRMCSGQLYLVCLKMAFNIGNLIKKTEGGVLKVDDVARASFNRLDSELEVVRDFAVAYDYAFRRGVRRVSAAARMHALAAKEAVGAVISELNRGSLQEVDLNNERFKVVQPVKMPIRVFGVSLPVRWFARRELGTVGLIESMNLVLDLNVLLAEKLEGSWPPVWYASGQTVPAGVRGLVRHLLLVRSARHDLHIDAEITIASAEKREQLEIPPLHKTFVST